MNIADRSVLRELIHREHTGERLGFGAGGQTGWSNIMTAVGHEIAKLRRKLKKMDASLVERRRQRSKSGALTVGLAGYTNVGKSSLFSALSGKPVLIKNQLFSTLETTVGRMANQPKIAMSTMDLLIIFLLNYWTLFLRHYKSHYLVICCYC